MKKNSYCLLAALFLLLFSGMSFAVDVDPCASWPVTLEEDADGFYEIGSADALYKFACMVNNGATNINGKLTADIVVNTNVLADADGVSKVDADGNYTGNAPANVWTPIGTDEHPYTGTFDGNGHTIRGLYFNENAPNVGLFGYIDESAKVQNVGVVDSYFKGHSRVGGVVGNNFGTVSNAYNTGSVSGDVEVGGVVGHNDHGTVSNAYNTGSVSGDLEVGGVVGNNFGTVSNAYNTGSVSGDVEVGGVVGHNDHGTVSNAYNTGSVSGDLEVGGVVGHNDHGTVSNAYNTGSVSGEDVGCVVGCNYKGTVSNGFFNTEVTCVYWSVVEGTTGKSSGEFADGTVAMLLHDWCEMDGETCKEGGLNGSIWGQNVGQATGNDAAPTLSGVLKLGPLTIAKNAAGKDSTAIDGASELEMKIPAEFNVPSVTFKRTFAGSGYSTIMLPFQPNCEKGDCIENSDNVKFYEFDSYTNGEVQATEVSPKDLKANTPYLVQAAGATELVFKNGGTFNTTTGDAYNSETGEYKVELGGDGAGWTIYGTYAYKTWEEGDAGLGKTYGFAGAADNDPAIVGKFAKVGVGAYIYPMRAYLEYTAPAALARPAANGEIRTVASLPDEIDVVIVDKDEKTGEQTTKVIGTINTRTGEFKFANDRWFDLNGRYLGNKKPTQKGTYYNNGKKVIVK